MKKILRDARKGEEDNVIEFNPPVPKPEGAPPSGPDWLRKLPFGARFLAKKKGNRQVFLELFGIGHITPNAILLAYESEYGPGMAMKYVDSREFSDRYIWVETLPEMKPLEEGEEETNENHLP